MASLTLLNKRAFDIPHCKIHEWRNARERKVRLGKGRVLWIKARTLSGKMVNIVNVYQTTANHPEMQKRIYETLTRVINAEHDPCILVGDFNANIKDGRANYAPPHPQNLTTIADEAFANFVGKTNGTLVPPAQSSWRNPFGGIRSREAKLDFAITYRLEGAVVEGYVDWISTVHDHARVGFTIGDSLWSDRHPIHTQTNAETR
jgi:endonuclease/exonuclease/phosphatase family metal-dependent hydrolase